MSTEFEDACENIVKKPQVFFMGRPTCRVPYLMGRWLFYDNNPPIISKEVFEAV